jgi:hypothetical protein
VAADDVDGGAISVLDLGTGTIKALVVEPGESRATVLASAAVPAPRPQPDGSRDLDELVAACERALVAAEDAAGVVPVRVFVGLTAQRATIAGGDAALERSRSSVPLSAEELRPLLRRAEQAALAAARRHDAAEFPTPTALQPLNATICALEVDGRRVGDLRAATGRRARLTLAGAFAPRAVVDQGAQLAQRLDLEMQGLLLAPFAVGGALARAGYGPAIVADVGAELTQVVLVGGEWAESMVALPLGGRSLEARVQAELGLLPAAAREAVSAHAAGAGARMAAGAAAARTIRQLAEHHAQVWTEALAVACGQLGRGGALPSALLLCGGASGLPELRRALATSAWHAGLPFEGPPAARWLRPQDLPAIVDRSAQLTASAAVPALCLAGVATGVYSPPTGFDALLRQAPPRPRRRPE